MDIVLLRVFQGQVLLQCQFVLLAAEDLNQAMAKRNVRHVFYALQNLLNAAANVAKALWGSKGTSAGRKPLRDSIGIGDDSPLRQVAMRNHFEHIDERLERWWQESERHFYVDLNLGMGSVAGVARQDTFRNFDPRTTNLTFWGDDFNVQNIIDEVLKILPKLQEQADKPPWETGEQ
jgi:hypothetical protein